MEQKYKELFRAFSVSQDGQLLKEHVENVLDELGDINTVTNDPIETRQKALQILRVKLLDPLTQKPNSTQEPDTYE